jgi:sec-independent protein translocase protein TatA
MFHSISIPTTQMGIGGLGYPELLLVLLIVLVVFGANRLPNVGSSLGQAIKNFKKGMKSEDADVSKPNKEKTE